MRHVNQYVVLYKFKLEGIKEALDFVQKDGFMFKFDLSSGYHHIDLHPSMFKYFGFSWSGKFYVFTSLPFGLSSAPFIFTKILRNLVRFWRERGVFTLFNILTTDFVLQIIILIVNKCQILLKILL